MSDIDYRNKFKGDVTGHENVTRSKHIRLIYELEQMVLSEFLAEIDSEKKSLMDFSCGTGRWTQFLEKHFSETLGVDVSDQMITAAKQKCAKADFVVTDITSNHVDEKVQDRQFDIITAFRFYKNAESPLRQSATRALPKYLKEGGYFIFDLHLNAFSFMGIFASLLRLLNAPKRFGIGKLTIRTISLNEIKILFHDSPFEIVDYYGMGLLPGRRNFTILPTALLHKLERFFTRQKILRSLSYNILVIARKK